jgi:hypothetical protein
MTPIVTLYQGSCYKRILTAFYMVRYMAAKECDVVGCTAESFQTVPADLASKLFQFKEKKSKVHLCRAHYKEYKKGTKKERELKRMDWV